MDQNVVIAILVAAALVLPLAGAVVGLIGKNSSAFNFAVQILNIAGGLSAFAAAIAFLLLQGQPGLNLNGDGGLDLSQYLPLMPQGSATLDSLSAYFLMIVGLGTALSSWYSISYLPRYRDTYRFPWIHAATALFVFGMLAAVLSGTPLAFLIAWEVMSFAAYFLVIADRTPASVKAGFSYIVMTQLGAACLIAGFALLAKGDFSVSLAALGDGVAPAAGLVAFFLMFAGFAAKAGLFPLHEWLPAAHPQAPSQASALMSGVMLKVALYGFLRAIYASMHFGLPFWVGLVVAAIGLFSGVYGALKATTETDVKRVLAWSSVENLGLMFAMAGTMVFLSAIGAYGAASLVMIALFVHALNHAIFKSGLFFAAGAIVAQTHTRDADLMGGLANKWPLFSKFFFGLCLAAAALPPLGTFYGEWMFLQTLGAGIASTGVLAGLIFAAIISLFALSAGLAVFAFVKLFAGIFLSKARSEHAAHAEKMPAGLTAPVAAAFGLSLALGLALPFVLKAIWPEGEGMLYLGQAVAVGEVSIKPFAIAMLIAAAAAVIWAARRFFTNRRVVKTDTWDCGAPLTARMEYSAFAFAAPIRFFFRFLTLPWKKFTVKPVSAENPWIASRSLEHGETPLAERYAYRPVARAVDHLAGKVKKLQNGVVQFYIALIFAALIVTLIVAL